MSNAVQKKVYLKLKRDLLSKTPLLSPIPEYFIQKEEYSKGISMLVEEKKYKCREDANDEQK